jgi:hypothetical protein
LKQVRNLKWQWLMQLKSNRSIVLTCRPLRQAAREVFCEPGVIIMLNHPSFAHYGRRAVRLFLFLLLTLVLLGVAGPLSIFQPQTAHSEAETTRVYLPYIRKPYNFHLQPPNPLNMSVRLDLRHKSGSQPGQSAPALAVPTLDTARAFQTIIPVTGGVITATAADNTLFTLTIPNQALYTATQITLIPLAAIDGKPLGGNAGAGVQLEPEGLEFFYPVTLTIQTTATIPVTAELPLAYHGDGQEFYRYPLALHHATPTFQLMHFSGVAYLGDGISIPVTPDSPVPTNTEDQLKQETQVLFQNERQAELMGIEGDPHFWGKVKELLHSYYDLVLRPEMLANRTNCDWTENGGFTKILGFERQVQLTGLADDFTQEHTEIWDSLEIAIHACWVKYTQPCVNYNDPHQVAEINKIANTAERFGLSGYDPRNLPECDCTGVAGVTAWNGTFHMSWTRSIEGVVNDNEWLQGSVSRSGDFTALLDWKSGLVGPEFRWQNGHAFSNPLLGSAGINDSSTLFIPPNVSSSDSTTGSGAPLDGAVTLDLDQGQCTYRLRFTFYLPVDDTSWGHTNIRLWDVDVMNRNAYVNPQAIELSGNEKMPVINPFIGEGVGYLGGSASGNLSPLFITAGFGSAQVSWNLVPAP